MIKVTIFFVMVFATSGCFSETIGSCGRACKPNVVASVTETTCTCHIPEKVDE